jgi:hypothetical protein
MDIRETHREIVKRIISDYAQFKPAHGDIPIETIFDEKQDHYELVHVGWKGNERIHGSVIHVDLVGDKIRIQHDGTEAGIATDLVEAGIPKDKIVLGFYLPRRRQLTGFAVA